MGTKINQDKAADRFLCVQLSVVSIGKAGKESVIQCILKGNKSLGMNKSVLSNKLSK